ncbi:MAG: helix-turn-helix transcriptional regulator [Clostridia bacterium]|nr:helix-turn-helix transcriptional regulator [Clostridia bacterium]
MYIDYSKLWKLLIDKNITKTELMQLTGISSRIIAKLSKNETVTTETLVKICTALNCDISDIMECKQEKDLSLYNYFRKYAQLVEENELTKKFAFIKNEQKYTVFITKKPSGKSNLISCESDGSIYWIQLYPFGGIMAPSVVKTVLIKPLKQKNENVFVVIKGKPNFQGLDEGIFVSVKNKNLTNQSIIVMSETEFKLM